MAKRPLCIGPNDSMDGQPVKKPMSLNASSGFCPSHEVQQHFEKIVAFLKFSGIFCHESDIVARRRMLTANPTEEYNEVRLLDWIAQFDDASRSVDTILRLVSLNNSGGQRETHECRFKRQSRVINDIDAKLAQIKANRETQHKLALSIYDTIAILYNTSDGKTRHRPDVTFELDILPHCGTFSDAHDIFFGNPSDFWFLPKATMPNSKNEMPSSIQCLVDVQYLIADRSGRASTIQLACLPDEDIDDPVVEALMVTLSKTFSITFTFKCGDYEGIRIPKKWAIKAVQVYMEMVPTSPVFCVIFQHGISAYSKPDHQMLQESIASCDLNCSKLDYLASRVAEPNVLIPKIGDDKKLYGQIDLHQTKHVGWYRLVWQERN